MLLNGLARWNRACWINDTRGRDVYGLRDPVVIVADEHNALLSTKGDIHNQ